MSIEELRELQGICLNDLEDDSKIANFINHFVEYLKNEKMTDELAVIVIKCVEIDRCANFFEFFDSLSKDEVQSLWKILKNNDYLKKNKHFISIKFLSLFIAEGYLLDGNARKILGNLISIYIELFNDEKVAISDGNVASIIKDYLLGDITSLHEFPSWEELKIKPEIIKQYVDIIQNVEGEKGFFNGYLNKGKSSALDLLEKERLEAKIPKNEEDKISAILENYKSVYEQVKKSVYEIDELEKKLMMQEEENQKLYRENVNLKGEMTLLNDKVDALNIEIAKAKQHIQDMKETDDIFGAFSENSGNDMLNEIASSLRTSYLDYIESKNKPMTETLGEIYRDSIATIFKILSDKGIKVE